MDTNIELVVLQNWIIIGLLLFLTATTIICNLLNMKRSKELYGEEDRERLSNLWETGKVDELLEVTDDILNNYPNRVDALYYRAKALRVRGCDDQAEVYYKKVIELEPSLKESLGRELLDIEQKSHQEASQAQ